MKAIWELIRDSYFAWNDDKAWRLGAALSYFAVFSLAPFFLIILVITGLVFGEAAAAARVIEEIQGFTGEQLALAIRATTANAYLSKSNIAATIFGSVMLLLGATGVFIQLREALNSIWYVEAKPLGTVKDFVRERLISFIIMLGIIFLFLVSPILSTVLSEFEKNLSGLLPRLGKSLQVADFVVSFLVFSGLFALVFKFLPDAEVEWRDVWIGATVTSFLFSIGKSAIGLYLGTSNIGTTFGAAKSLVTVMLWTFYSAQILLYGAEFTKIYANRYGSKIIPSRDAVQVAIRKIQITPTSM